MSSCCLFFFFVNDCFGGCLMRIPLTTYLFEEWILLVTREVNLNISPLTKGIGYIGITVCFKCNFSIQGFFFYEIVCNGRETFVQFTWNAKGDNPTLGFDSELRSGSEEKTHWGNFQIKLSSVKMTNCIDIWFSSTEMTFGTASAT